MREQNRCGKPCERVTCSICSTGGNCGRPCEVKIRKQFRNKRAAENKQKQNIAKGQKKKEHDHTCAIHLSDDLSCNCDPVSSSSVLDDVLNNVNKNTSTGQRRSRGLGYVSDDEDTESPSSSSNFSGRQLFTSASGSGFSSNTSVPSSEDDSSDGTDGKPLIPEGSGIRNDPKLLEALDYLKQQNFELSEQVESSGNYIDNLEAKLASLELEFTLKETKLVESLKAAEHNLDALNQQIKKTGSERSQIEFGLNEQIKKKEEQLTSLRGSMEEGLLSKINVIEKLEKEISSRKGELEELSLICKNYEKKMLDLQTSQLETGTLLNAAQEANCELQKIIEQNSLAASEKDRELNLEKERTVHLQENVISPLRTENESLILRVNQLEDARLSAEQLFKKLELEAAQQLSLSQVHNELQAKKFHEDLERLLIEQKQALETSHQTELRHKLEELQDEWNKKVDALETAQAARHTAEIQKLSAEEDQLFDKIKEMEAIIERSASEVSTVRDDNYNLTQQTVDAAKRLEDAFREANLLKLELERAAEDKKNLARDLQKIRDESTEKFRQEQNKFTLMLEKSRREYQELNESFREAKADAKRLSERLEDQKRRRDEIDEAQQFTISQQEKQFKFSCEQLERSLAEKHQQSLELQDRSLKLQENLQREREYRTEMLQASNKLQQGAQILINQVQFLGDLSKIPDGSQIVTLINQNLNESTAHQRSEILKSSIGHSSGNTHSAGGGASLFVSASYSYGHSDGQSWKSGVDQTLAKQATEIFTKTRSISVTHSVETIGQVKVGVLPNTQNLTLSWDQANSLLAWSHPFIQLGDSLYRVTPSQLSSVRVWVESFRQYNFSFNLLPEPLPNPKQLMVAANKISSLLKDSAEAAIKDIYNETSQSKKEMNQLSLEIEKKNKDNMALQKQLTDCQNQIQKHLNSLKEKESALRKLELQKTDQVNKTQREIQCLKDSVENTQKAQILERKTAEAKLALLESDSKKSLTDIRKELNLARETEKSTLNSYTGSTLSSIVGAICKQMGTVTPWISLSQNVSDIGLKSIEQVFNNADSAVKFAEALNGLTDNKQKFNKCSSLISAVCYMIIYKVIGINCDYTYLADCIAKYGVGKELSKNYNPTWRVDEVDKSKDRDMFARMFTWNGGLLLSNVLRIINRGEGKLSFNLIKFNDQREEYNAASQKLKSSNQELVKTNKERDALKAELGKTKTRLSSVESTLAEEKKKVNSANKKVEETRSSLIEKNQFHVVCAKNGWTTVQCGNCGEMVADHKSNFSINVKHACTKKNHKSSFSYKY